MKTPKPTRADKRHLNELVEAVNEAFVTGKPMTDALQLVMLRRWEVQSTYDSKVHRLKQRVKELEDDAKDRAVERDLNT